MSEADLLCIGHFCVCLHSSERFAASDALLQMQFFVWQLSLRSTCNTVVVWMSTRQGSSLDNNMPCVADKQMDVSFVAKKLNISDDRVVSKASEFQRLLAVKNGGSSTDPATSVACLQFACEK
jgi:hypothetical protein